MALAYPGEQWWFTCLEKGIVILRSLGPGESAESPAGRDTLAIPRTLANLHLRRGPNRRMRPGAMAPRGSPTVLWVSTPPSSAHWGARAQLGPLRGGVTWSQPPTPRPHSAAGAGRRPVPPPQPPRPRSAPRARLSRHHPFPAVPRPLAPFGWCPSQVRPGVAGG